MRVLTPHFIAHKRVLFRADLDVPLKKVDGKWVVADDFRLMASLPTLYLCMQYAQQVIVCGHLGRPEGKVDPNLSVAPIVEWLDSEFPSYDFPEDRLLVLENLRFESGEDGCSEVYAKELASMADVFVFEALAAHHRASSTVLVSTLMPSAVGFHFDHEMRVLKEVRNNPKQPLIAIIGGAKIEDKISVVEALSKIADKVLLGGKLPSEIKAHWVDLPLNTEVAEMSEDGLDISEETIKKWQEYISEAKQIIWSGPMGNFEQGHLEGTQKIAEAIISSGAESIVGGGDTVSAITELGFLDSFSFVSTGGGAMLKLLADGTLPSIEALE